MAKTEKSTEAKEGKATRGKKGDGPVIITYLDAEGNSAKRVSETTVAVRVSNKSNEVVDYTIDQLPPAIRGQLIALALAKRIDTYVRNGADETGSNVLELASSVFDTLKSGAVYTRKEGSGGNGAGRPFDFVFWRGVMAATASAKKKTVTDKQLDAFVTKLTALTPSERKDHIAQLKNDKVFAFCAKQAELAKAKESLKKDVGDVDALAEMF